MDAYAGVHSSGWRYARPGSMRFFVETAQLSGLAMAEAFTRALPRIEGILEASNTPTWGSIHSDGRISIIDIDA